MSALESLEAINQRLIDLQIQLHLSEVKGTVMDRLKDTHFLDMLLGSVFLARFDVERCLTPDMTITTSRQATSTSQA